MDEKQFLAATEGTVEQRDVNVRQITNGFVLAGQVRYLDPNTTTVKVSVQSEAVATGADTALEAAHNFLTTGKF